MLIVARLIASVAAADVCIASAFFAASEGNRRLDAPLRRLIMPWRPRMRVVSGSIFCFFVCLRVRVETGLDRIKVVVLRLGCD